MIAIAIAISTQTTAHAVTRNQPSGSGLMPGKRLDGSRSFPEVAATLEHPLEMSRNRLI